MTEKSHGKKSPIKKWQKTLIRVILCALFALSVFFFVSGGLPEKRYIRQAMIEDNVRLLSTQEHAAPVRWTKVPPSPTPEMQLPNETPQVFDLAAEKQKIIALQDWSKASFHRWFRDAAIAGDSLTFSTVEYEWLGTPPVFAKIGARVSDEMPLLDDLEAACPSVIFLCFGNNDIESYGKQVEHFIQRYTACIVRLKTTLPDAEIYVNALFPVKEHRIRKNSDFQYISLYNEELQKMCRDLDVTYIDSNFIPEAFPEYFEPDGQHMKTRFYPRWLTYLADLAGLSKDE